MVNDSQLRSSQKLVHYKKSTIVCRCVYTCHPFLFKGSNNYSLVWVPMDGSSTAVVSQASQAMAGAGGIVWPGLGTAGATQNTSTGQHIDSSVLLNPYVYISLNMALH